MTNGRKLLHLLCVVAAFQPNCTRSCPTGIFSCTCEWDWQECPPPPSCGSSSPLVASDDAGMLVVALPDATSFTPKVVDEPAGGTIAFAQTKVGTFVIAVIAELDLARVIRVDVGDDGNMRAHVLGDVAFGRAKQPGRVVVDDRGFAHVVLRGSGEIATVDPTRLAVVARERPCASRGVAFDHGADAILVACESGDLVKLDPVTGEETKRTFVDRGLRDVAMDGDAVVASTRAHLFMMGSDGSFTTHEDGRSLRAFAARWPDVVIAHDDGLELAPLDGSPARALGAITAVSDLAVGDDGTIVVAANGRALTLPTGAPAFSTLSTPSFVTPVALAREGSLDVIAVETAEATVAISVLADATDLVVVE